jgi:hypothetical protein
MVDGEVTSYTPLLFSGKFFCVYYEYNCDGKIYRKRECFTSEPWFGKNYKVPDTIKIMVSKKDPNKSCLFLAYNKFDSEYSKEDFLKLAISSGVTEIVADKVFDFLYMNNGYKTKPRLSDELDNLITASGNNSIYLPIFAKLGLSNPESNLKNMIISNKTVGALCIAINRIYRIQNGLL